MSGLLLTIHARGDGCVELRAPAVGFVRDVVDLGAVVVPLERVGFVDTLGVLRPLLVPEGVGGRVVARLDTPKSRTPVDYGSEILRVDPSSALATAIAVSAHSQITEHALAFRAPMSGRFYARLSPSKPPLVRAGDVVSSGQTMCLLEIMKTFNRVSYGGPGLPERARITRVCVDEGADVQSGDALFDLEEIA